MNIPEFESEFGSRLRNLAGGEELCALKFGLGVSGGADSVCMLELFSQILPPEKIFVLTISHRIRKEAESDGDADFVAELCRKKNIFCEVKKFPEGLAAQTAKERGGGLEEAARFLRYGAFKEFVEAYGLDFFCTAHNADDLAETILMRFLQGSDAGGIQARRGFYLRPMLAFSRGQIVSYLQEAKVAWREDSTNCDTAYLRNRIRRNLIPVLDENFCGWRKAVGLGEEKRAADDSALKEEAARFKWLPEKNSCGLKTARAEFFAAHPALRRRIFYKGLSTLGASRRVPYEFARKIAEFSGGDSVLEAAGISVEFSARWIFLRKKKGKVLEQGFAILAEGAGEFILDPEDPSEKVVVQGKSGSVRISYKDKGVELKIRFPFWIRSRSFGDSEVSELLAKKKIPAEFRDKIPIIEEAAGLPAIACVLC